MINKQYKLPCPRCGQVNIITLDNVYIRCVSCKFPLMVVRVIKKSNHNGGKKNRTNKLNKDTQSLVV